LLTQWYLQTSIQIYEKFSEMEGNTPFHSENRACDEDKRIFSFGLYTAALSLSNAWAASELADRGDVCATGF